MRILFATIGSLGDLYPCLALAVELKRRGHTVTIASTELYRSRALKLGLGFHALRPNWDPADSELIRQCEDLKSGPEILLRKLVLPHVEDTYADLMDAVQGASELGDGTPKVDLMLACELVYAAPLIAEKLKLPWASLILSPCSFFSAYDPSLLVNVPSLYKLRRAGWWINQAALVIGTRLTQHWWKPVKQLRIREGLREDCAPLTKDKFSPQLVLALFSSALAKAQPDWPAHTIQPGFVFYQEEGEKPGLEELDRFLAAGEPPIVFTLGSTVVARPGNFYQASAEAAIRLGKRAVLIGVSEVYPASENILALPYAPYAHVFAHACLVVHQGGSGTTAQALRAGKPMLFVPFGWDQPDNGARVERQGAGLVLARTEYSADTAVFAIKRLLEDASFTQSAAALGNKINSENGVQGACDAIEGLANYKNN